MIKRAADLIPAEKVNMRGGDGTVLVNNVTNEEEMNGKGRLFGPITLNPGCSIGFHMHEKESELFYLVQGKAEYNDNGTLVPVEAGDMMLCRPGEGHGIANHGDEVVLLVAVIVYE